MMTLDGPAATGSHLLPLPLRLRPDRRHLVLGDIELLELIPRGDDLSTRRLLVGCEEISDEVAIATDRDPLESRHPGGSGDTRLQIPANLRRHQTGLFDDEVLRFTVARVVLDPERQADATFEVLGSRPAQCPLRGQRSVARA